MAIPTSYTEATLAAYLNGQAGAVAGLLSWTVAGDSYDELVADTLLTYGTDDISTISGTGNIRALRALARRTLWRAVIPALAGFYDYSTPDGFSEHESQLQKQAVASLSLAESDCAALGVAGDAYAVEVTPVRYVDDPYVWYPDTERTRPT